MPVKITRPDGTRITIETLRDLTKNVNPKFCFCLAAKTAFVFIGTAEELKQGAEHIDEIYKADREDYIPLLDRKVTGYRKKDVPGEPRHMILIEGSERGAFWLRREYQVFVWSGWRKLPVSRSLIAYIVRRILIKFRVTFFCHDKMQEQAVAVIEHVFPGTEAYPLIEKGVWDFVKKKGFTEKELEIVAKAVIDAIPGISFFMDIMHYDTVTTAKLIKTRFNYSTELQCPPIPIPRLKQG